MVVLAVAVVEWVAAVVEVAVEAEDHSHNLVEVDSIVAVEQLAHLMDHIQDSVHSHTVEMDEDEREDVEVVHLRSNLLDLLRNRNSLHLHTFVVVAVEAVHAYVAVVPDVVVVVEVDQHSLEVAAAVGLEFLPFVAAAAAEVDLVPIVVEVAVEAIEHLVGMDCSTVDLNMNTII